MFRRSRPLRARRHHRRLAPRSLCRHLGTAAEAGQHPGHRLLAPHHRPPRPLRGSRRRRRALARPGAALRQPYQRHLKVIASLVSPPPRRNEEANGGHHDDDQEIERAAWRAGAGLAAPSRQAPVRWHIRYAVERPQCAVDVADTLASIDRGRAGPSSGTRGSAMTICRPSTIVGVDHPAQEPPACPESGRFADHRHQARREGSTAKHRSTTEHRARIQPRSRADSICGPAQTYNESNWEAYVRGFRLSSAVEFKLVVK